MVHRIHFNSVRILFKIFLPNLSNPHNSSAFINYLNRRDFKVAPSSNEAGDLGEEGLLVISDDNSSLPDQPLLVVANESTWYNHNLSH